MEHSVLLPNVALVFILGIMCQWVSWRFRIPSIVLLAVSGLLIGPVFHLINPSHDLGHLLEIVVKLAVAIILFEGGLNLRLHELKHTGRAVKQLIGFGLPLSWFFGFLVCHWVGGLSVTVSLLLSAILVVTGPTVIMPLIRQTKMQARTSSLLKWEGILNDPIGVLLAVLVFQFAVATENLSLNQAFLLRISACTTIVIAVSVGAGYFLKFVFEKGHVPEFLKLPMVLSLVLCLYVFANMLQEEIGLLAVTVLGMTMGNIGMLIIYELRKFKENITLILVSVVFILLTADTSLETLFNLNWRALAFLFCFLFIVRPLSVWISTVGSGLTWQEKTFIGWIAPRGIVAASIAGLLGLQLKEHGFHDAELLAPLVFALIFATVTLHGFSIQWLANRLGLASNSKEGVLIIGSTPWSIDLAAILQSAEIPVLLVDSSWHNLKEARLRGIPVHYGEIMSEDSEENLDLSETGYLLAATGNDAYNALVCNAFVHHLGRNRVFQLGVHEKKEESKELRGSSRGMPAFEGELLHEELISKHFKGWKFQKTRLTEEFDYQNFKDANPKDFEPLILLRKNGAIDFNFPKEEGTPKAEDTIISFSLQNNGKS